MRAPTAQSITVDSIEQRLRDRLEEVVGREVGLPQAFACAEKLVGRRTGDDEVLCEVDAADGVEAVASGMLALRSLNLCCARPVACDLTRK